MPVVLHPIGPCFAAEVEGRRPDPADLPGGGDGDPCRHGHYAVPVFHDQRIDDGQQLAFTRRLGEIEHAIGTSLRAPDEYRLPTTFADVSNLDKYNRVFAPKRPA